MSSLFFLCSPTLTYKSELFPWLVKSQFLNCGIHFSLSLKVQILDTKNFKPNSLVGKRVLSRTSGLSTWSSGEGGPTTVHTDSIPSLQRRGSFWMSTLMKRVMYKAGTPVTCSWEGSFPGEATKGATFLRGSSARLLYVTEAWPGSSHTWASW